MENIRKKSKKYILKVIYIALLLGIILMPAAICQASSASITLSTKDDSITVGDKIIISIELSSDALLGDFEAYMKYNPDVLEFNSDASFVAGGEGLLKLTDTNVAEGDNTRKYVINFTAKAIGNSEITIKDNSTVYDYESGSAMSLSSNHLNVLVEAKKTASDNNYLKSLKINPGTLSPKFDKDTTSYSVTLSNEVDKLIVSSVTEDENATVTLEGNEKLSVGLNKIIVKVESESGDVKEYTIDATREEEKNNNSNEINEEDETDNIKDGDTSEYNNIDNGTVEIGKVKVIQNGDDLIIENGYKYQIIKPGDDVKIPDGYMETTIILDGITVTAYTLKNDLDNDFLLLYAQNLYAQNLYADNAEGETSFYQYDRKEGTMQRYIKGTASNDNKVVYSNEMINSDEYKNKLMAMGIVIAVLGSICIIMSVILIHNFLKKKEE